MIVVPSYGRAGSSATLKALDGVENVIVAAVEEEADAYTAAYPLVPVTTVPRGIGPARQAILQLARRSGWGPFWMIDDDILSTSIRLVGGPLGNVPMPYFIETLESVLAPYLNEKIALAGPNFRHRAWVDPYGVHMDKHLRAFVRVNPAAPFDYWPHLKEDLDATLTVLLRGWHTVMFNQFVFDTAQMGANDGGNSAAYERGELDEACKALVEKYPGVVSLRLNEETGQLESPVNWRRLREMVPA